VTLVADEGVDKQIVRELRSAGYIVEYVAEMDPGISDNEVLQRARDARALLLTEDKDFGELVYRQQQASFGVVLLRMAGLTSLAKTECVLAAFVEHATEFADAFTVISARNVRIRRPN
jgi:predicted nuclease of predicted toxin-antitoxin system